MVKSIAVYWKGTYIYAIFLVSYRFAQEVPTYLFALGDFPETKYVHTKIQIRYQISSSKNLLKLFFVIDYSSSLVHQNSKSSKMSDWEDSDEEAGKQKAQAALQEYLNSSGSRGRGGRGGMGRGMRVMQGMGGK